MFLKRNRVLAGEERMVGPKTDSKQNAFQNIIGDSEVGSDQSMSNETSKIMKNSSGMNKVVP